MRSWVPALSVKPSWSRELPMRSRPRACRKGSSSTSESFGSLHGSSRGDRAAAHPAEPTCCRIASRAASSCAIHRCEASAFSAFSRIAAIGLRISCARPADSRPTAASRSAAVARWRSSASRAPVSSVRPPGGQVPVRPVARSVGRSVVAALCPCQRLLDQRDLPRPRHRAHGRASGRAEDRQGKDGQARQQLVIGRSLWP